MVIRGPNDSSPGHVFGLHLACASGSAEEVSQPRRRPAAVLILRGSFRTK